MRLHKTVEKSAHKILDSIDKLLKGNYIFIIKIADITTKEMPCEEVIYLNHMLIPVDFRKLFPYIQRQDEYLFYGYRAGNLELLG